MGALGGALVSTMRPWRSLYAFSCCCLLPLSAALRPAATTANRPSGFARPSTRYCSGSRSSSGRRSSTLSAAASASAASATARSMSSWGEAATTVAGLPASILHQRRASWKLFYAGGGGGVATCAISPLLWDSTGGRSTSITRAFSGGKRPKLRGRARWGAGRAAAGGAGGAGGRRGGALGMGKGLGRKKAKKDQVHFCKVMFGPS